MAEVEPPPLFDDEDLFYEDKNEINADIEKEVNSVDKNENSTKGYDFCEDEVPLDSPAATSKSFPPTTEVSSQVVDHKNADDPPRLTTSDLNVSPSKPPPGFKLVNNSTTVKSTADMPEEPRHKIEITVSNPKKVGDGMNAYMTYQVSTKTSVPDFHRSEMEVYRRFSDFLGLHEKLVEKYLHDGRIIPPPPEKSVIGMAKIKVSKEESGSTEFVERRRAALERFLNRIARHPILRKDPNFVDFLELDGDLPKATNTSALSSAGVMRLFNRVGDSIGKMAYKMDETDQWFEKKTLEIESLDVQLKKLHTCVETLVANRRDLAQNTGLFAKSAALLASVEEHASLSRVLSQLAEVEEKLDSIHVAQADNDYFLLSEFIKDYIGVIQSVKDALHERIKLYKVWKDNEVMLAKKREVKVRMELAHKMDKTADATREINEWENNVEKSQEDFEKISKNIHKELVHFESQKYKDFQATILSYLESLMDNQQQLIRHWETFLPEAKCVV